MMVSAPLVLTKAINSKGTKGILLACGGGNQTGVDFLSFTDATYQATRPVLKCPFPVACLWLPGKKLGRASWADCARAFRWESTCRALAIGGGARWLGFCLRKLAIEKVQVREQEAIRHIHQSAHVSESTDLLLLIFIHIVYLWPSKPSLDECGSMCSSCRRIFSRGQTCRMLLVNGCVVCEACLYDSPQTARRRQACRGSCSPHERDTEAKCCAHILRVAHPNLAHDGALLQTPSFGLVARYSVHAPYFTKTQASCKLLRCGWPA